MDYRSAGRPGHRMRRWTVRRLGGTAWWKTHSRHRLGIGLERLVLMLQAAEVKPAGLEQHAQIYLAAVGDVHAQALQLAARVRDALPSVSLLTHRSEEHTSELQSRGHLVCRLLLDKKK